MDSAGHALPELCFELLCGVAERLDAGGVGLQRHQGAQVLAGHTISQLSDHRCAEGGQLDEGGVVATRFGWRSEGRDGCGAGLVFRQEAVESGCVAIMSCWA